MTTNREEVVERMVEAYCSNKSPQCMDAMRTALSIAEEAVLEELMECALEPQREDICAAFVFASPLYRRVKGE